MCFDPVGFDVLDTGVDVFATSGPLPGFVGAFVVMRFAFQSKWTWTIRLVQHAPVFHQLLRAEGTFGPFRRAAGSNDDPGSLRSARNRIHSARVPPQRGLRGNDSRGILQGSAKSAHALPRELTEHTEAEFLQAFGDQLVLRVIQRSP
jgi:hypothetical protein